MSEMGCSPMLLFLVSVILWSVAIVRTTDGASILWYEPPPVENVTDTSVFHNADRVRAVGSLNEPLTWNFSLPAGASVITVSLRFRVDRVVTLVPADPSSTVEAVFRNRFSVSWFPPSKATLTIFNITVDDDGEFACEVFSSGGGTRTWTSRIELTVFDPPQITDISGNQTVIEGGQVTLNCTAAGDPDPSTFWTRLSDNRNVTMPLTNIRRHEGGRYRCTAYNGFGSPATSVVFINVPFPPSITHISSDQNVTEGHNVTLDCTAGGNPTPNITWTRLSDNITVIMPLTDIRRPQDKDVKVIGYRCTAINDVGIPATRDVFINVQFPPIISNTSKDQTVNEGNNVTLNCTADGNPKPTISWTRLSDDSVVTIPLTISGKGDEGSYTCTADNGIGNPARSYVSINVQNYRPTGTNLTTNLTNNTVVVNEPFNLWCGADANPSAHYRLYKEEQPLTTITDNQIIGTFTTSVGERRKQVTYICTPFNSFGVGPPDRVSITVLYNPANVTLVGNPTENKNCSDLLWVNFTCETSDANPAVQSYLRMYDEGEVSNRGTWIKNISVPGKHVYGCIAQHPVGNVPSSNNVTVTFNVVVQISVDVISGNETLAEGGAVSLNCSASGFPVPTVTWSKLGDGGFVNRSHWLNFTSVTKDDVGNYMCHANNTCGKTSSAVRTIDVQYQPTNVTLNVSTSKACQGDTVEFKCEAEANPAVHTYILYKNGPMHENMSGDGVARGPLDTEGQVTYKCEASNSVGTVASTYETVTVKVPASVTSVNKTTVVKEGEDVTLLCSVSGDPTPNVSWVNEKNDVMVFNATWKVLNIDRNYTGGYKCTASNECGSDSKTTNISVEFPPSATSPERSKTVPLGARFTFTCMADGNPPPSIRWYKGSEPSGAVLSRDTELELTLTGQSDSGFYICFVNNSLGNDSLSFELSVEEQRTSTATSPIQDQEKARKQSAELEIKKENGVDVEYEEDFKNLSSEASKNFTESFVRTMDVVYGNDQNYVETNVTGLRKGSVIVSFDLIFNTPVTTNEAFAKLRSALTVNGTFGPYEVGNLIVLMPTNTSPTTPTKKKDDGEGPALWVVIAAVVGGVALLAFVVGLVTWCVYNKRKCKKDTKIHHSDTDEEHALQEVGVDNNYAEVNHGYARSGPPSANGADSAGGQQVGAVPTYAVVDKSTKKHKNKKEKEEKPPEYAVVDKSQKKKKKNDKVDDTYAEVDKSKKTSQKKPRPGEDVVYADLGDLDRPQMTPVVTSPKTLPPIKKPEPYQETQYADITQFMKGDAILPKDDKNEGAEMKPQEEKKDEVEAENKPKETPM